MGGENGKMLDGEIVLTYVTVETRRSETDSSAIAELEKRLQNLHES